MTEYEKWAKFDDEKVKEVEKEVDEAELRRERENHFLHFIQFEYIRLDGDCQTFHGLLETARSQVLGVDISFYFVFYIYLL